MSYFSKFSLVLYSFGKGQKDKIIQNISKYATVRKALKENDAILIPYEVQDGETPEIVAHKIYGRADYHWLILLTNDIGNVYCDWLKDYEEVVAITEKKYGVGNEDEPHHYETPDGYIVPEGEGTAVSNLQYEIDQNELKRSIKLLNPEFASLAEKELEKNLGING